MRNTKTREGNVTTSSDLLRMSTALCAIVQALDGTRNRFGKLETECRQGEDLRKLAVLYKVGGSYDAIEQAVKVAKAVLNLHMGFPATQGISQDSKIL